MNLDLSRFIVLGGVSSPSKLAFFLFGRREYETNDHMSSIFPYDPNKALFLLAMAQPHSHIIKKPQNTITSNI